MVVALGQRARERRVRPLGPLCAEEPVDGLPEAPGKQILERLLRNEPRPRDARRFHQGEPVCTIQEQSRADPVVEVVRRPAERI